MQLTNLLKGVSQLSKAFATLLTALLQISPAVAGQLLLLQKTLPGLRPRKDSGKAGIRRNDVEVAGIQLANIMDGPVVNTRAGMYIYLESSVSGPSQMRPYHD